MKSHRIAALCAIFALSVCGRGLATGQEAESASHIVSTAIGLGDETPTASRVVPPVDDQRLVMLRGNTHPLARQEFDRGRVDAQLPAERLTLVLKRSAAQEAALEAFMERQQDEKSADYHHWLEPEEIGKLYGPSDADIAAVTNWLQNQGFRIDNVNKSRTLIEFSGVVGTVQKAFHTEIHHYYSNGEEHMANNADPSIPLALMPVVQGVVGLNTFYSTPQHVFRGSFKRDKKTGKWESLDPEMISRPDFGVTTTNGTIEMVSPYDFATIYNVAPLWTAGTDGTGVTIAIAGRSDIALADVAAFRKAFGLPVKAPTVIVNGADPGVPSANDKVENTLDVEWSGAVAKGATIKFVTSKSSGQTLATDGAILSSNYIINNKVAPIMSLSYGICELFAGTSGNALYNTLWQAGAAAGISIFVASGDQDSAVCDGGQQAPYEAQYGLEVSASSSTPYNVAVGGTDYQWSNITNKTYWATKNATNGSSALGYIPEIPWNDTCGNDVIVDIIDTNNSLTFDEEELCNQAVIQNVDTFLVNVEGGTGGVSSCTVNNTSTTADPKSCSGGYAKPSWQTGTGVIAGSKREVPDLSLFAADGVLSSMYVICDSQIGPCTFTNPDDASAQGVGGTSVASPAMAGIMALIVQKAGGGAQGLPNKNFYTLAAKDNRATCNTNTVANGSACNFYDVTTSTIAVPCAAGSPNCTIKDAGQGDTFGMIGGYKSTVGFDRATGLGTVNAANLVKNWPAGTTGGGSITLTPNAIAFPKTVTATTSAATAVTIKNAGSTAATISSISITGTNATSFLQVNTCGASLAAGASCVAYVAFKPASAAALTAKLSVADNASGSPQTATLTGTGVAKPLVKLSKTALTFASTAKGVTTAAQSVTVTNGGAATLNITSITLTGTNPTSFIELNTCGPTLAPAATCTVDVAFKPAVAGALKASVVIADNGSTATQTITLTGTGH